MNSKTGLFPYTLMISAGLVETGDAPPRYLNTAGGNHYFLHKSGMVIKIDPVTEELTRLEEPEYFTS